MTAPIAMPSRDDPAVAEASAWVGGPAGDHAGARPRWWSPLRIALAVACAVMALGVVADEHCHDDGWASRDDRSNWTALCYSDVPYLYRERGLASGAMVYRDVALEYPVLTGALMQVTALVVRTVDVIGEPVPADGGVEESVRFYDVTAVLMGLAGLVVVIATARTVPRRPWDAMLVAASPLLLLTATINWDLLAVALASLAILAWTRERPVAAGVLIGLGTAAKLYPVLLLGPMFLVAWRAPDRRAALGRFLATVLTAVLSWCAVNLPVAIWAPDGWRAFFSFNADRGPDFGSVWYALDVIAPDLLPERIDTLVVVVAVVLLALIVALALKAPEPPRLAQLAFLAVAAFLLVNKVWSPQYTLWLLPLAVLARPRWRDLLIWQAVEVMYFVAVWWHLATIFDPTQPLISNQTYAMAIVLRVAALLWLAGLIVADILKPENDPVRPYVTAAAT